MPLIGVAILGGAATTWLYGGGFSSFLTFAGFCAILATILAVFLGLSARYGPTRQSVLAEIQKRQWARRGEPRDLAALGATDTEERRRLRRRRPKRCCYTGGPAR